MYPSDYLYCYAYGVDDSCFNSGLNCRSSSGKTNSWLYNNSGFNQCIISVESSNTMWALLLNSNGTIDGNGNPWWQSKFKPTLYLKPNVKIKSGDGSIDNPYEFEL